MSRKHIKSHKLFTPGPVEVKKSVLDKMAKPVLFHRTGPFEKIYASVQRKLIKVFGADERFTALILSGSGTMANEAVIISLIKPNEKLLIASNGQFGERLATIAEIHNVDFELVDFGWAKPIDIPHLRKKIELYKPDWVFAVLLETSTGMVNPINKIGKLCKNSGAKLFVDAVSGLGAEALSITKDNIAVCTSVPNKALEVPPGLSFVCVGKSLLDDSDNNPKSYYLDLKRYYMLSQNSQTPTTPAIPIFVSLNKALDLLIKEGLPKRRKRYLKMSLEVRRFCKELEIPLLISDKEYQASAITTLVLPSHNIAEELQRYLQKRGVTVWHHNYAKDDPRLNSLVQIAVMGDINVEEIKNLFKRISNFLKNEK